jgi:hypothetical protein
LIKSAIWRSVTNGSWTLIDDEHIVGDLGKNIFVELGAEIDLADDDFGEFISLAEIIKTHTIQGPRLKLSQHIHIARRSIKISPYHRSKKA